MNPTSGRERRWWNQLRCGRADDSAAAAFALAELLWDRNREDEAETVLRECARTDHDPIAAAAKIRLARLVERRHGPGAAEKVYNEAAVQASASDSADVLIDIAARWVTLDRLAEAVHAYRAVARDCPDHRLRAVAGYRLGVIERENGRLLSAIRTWEIALGYAEDSLRVHLLVSLGEARLEQASDGDLGGEELLAQAIASDHPDLAPQAAFRLAQLKRAQGELIDAYRLIQLVADSGHPIYGPEAEVERERLVRGELNSLLELDAPDPRQLSMENLTAEGAERSIHLPVLSSIQTSHSYLSWARFCRWSSVHLFDDENPPPADHRLRDVPPQRDRLGGGAGNAFLWKAILGRLDASDLWTVKDAIERDRVQLAPPHRASECSPPLLPADNSCQTFHGGEGELEFLLLLRVAAWLKSAASPQRRKVSGTHFRMVFDRTSKRLEKLLDDDQYLDSLQSNSLLSVDRCRFRLRDIEDIDPLHSEVCLSRQLDSAERDEELAPGHGKANLAVVLD
ncbi:MAG: hypothetical protein WB507_00495 [Solirubrobacterales bacterium]